MVGRYENMTTVILPMDVVFLLYGLAFLGMGLVILVRYDDHSRPELGNTLWLLAAFGFLHGFREWMDLWRAVHGDGPGQPQARALLLLLSFLPLLEFGRRLLRESLDRPPWLTAPWSPVLAAGAALGLGLGGPSWPLSLEIWSRLLCGLPGGLMSALGLWLYCRRRIVWTDQTPERRLILWSGRIAAGSFALYAAAGGLIGPQGPVALAALINQTRFLALTGLPIQLVRAACAVAAAVSIGFLMRIFLIEARQRLLDSNRRLAESESRFRLMTESVEDYALFMLDPEGCVMSWNAGAKRMKGYEENEILGRSLACFYTPDDLAAGKPQTLLAEAVARGWAEDMGWRLRRDGSRFQADVVLSAIRDPAGTLLGFTKVTRDITQRVMLEDRLRRSNQDLQRFAEVTAHHLQEPAARLARYADRLTGLLAGRLDDPEARLALDFIGQQARRQKALLRDVQRYLAADQPRGEISAIDVAALLTRLTGAMAARIAATGAVIDLGALPPVLLDRPRLLDLFEVALDNALTYAAPARNGAPPLRIAVHGEERAGGVRYCIDDNGPGIESQYRERVFRVFERLTGDGEGTGIGLAIVRRVAESIGGTAAIAVSPEGGCRLILDLPAKS